MKIKARDISAGELEGIGRLLFSAAAPSLKPAEECSFSIIAEDLGLTDPCCAGSMDCAPRPMLLTRMERHRKTPEILAAIDGDSVVCIAPAQDPVAGSLKGIRAVTVRKGQVFILETGAWHWIPYPLGARPARFLVVFRRRTGQEDLEFHELAQSVSIDA
jgi:hypothetical protein